MKMNKQIFKKYKTLGKWYDLTVPVSTSKSAVFYQKYKTAIDFESVMYGQIHHDRQVLGGNDKIHKIDLYERNKKEIF
jgi:hypothetical protein